MAVVAGATILLQLVQTRVLSYLFAAHIVYFTVTIALIGFGVSGALSAIAIGRRTHSDLHAAVAALLFALSIVPCAFLASYTTKLVDPERVWVALTVCYLLQAIPFICAGYALSVAFFLGGERMHRLYFLDLCASAVAVLVFSYGFERLGAEGALWLCVALLTLASSLLLWTGHHKRASLVGPIAAALTFALAGPRFLNDVPFDKILSDALKHGATVEHTVWHPIARIDVVSHPRYDIVTRKIDELNAPNQKIITQDGGANTFMPSAAYREVMLRQGDPAVRPFPQNVMYELVPAPAKALVIGVGGGFDVVSARAYAAQSIVGVEMNGATIELVRGRYGAFAGWPSWPGVSLLFDEGRRYTRTTEHEFDTIMLKGVDTYSALSSGAYIFSENYLYNVEALQDYLAALRPGGMITVHRHLFSPPRETLRLVVNSWYAKHGMGVRDTVMVLGNASRTNWAATLLKNEPFTLAQVDRAVVAMEHDSRVFPLYVPRLQNSAALDARVRALREKLSPNLRATAALFERVVLMKSEAELERFIEAYPYNISATWDDRPFFFDYRKGNFLASVLTGKPLFPQHSLALLMTVIVGVMAAAVLGPLRAFARQGVNLTRSAPLLGFFACLGFGYMFAEIGMMQTLTLYLGQPIHSLSAVLGGLLFFTGVGALLSERLVPSVAALPRKLLTAALIIAGWLLLMKLMVLPRTYTLGATLRTVIVVVSLAPVGIVLGLPFATAIRHLSSRQPRFIPWAWGINGLTSVAGSILAIVVAMHAGFPLVIAVAALSYVLAALFMKRVLRESPG